MTSLLALVLLQNSAPAPNDLAAYFPVGVGSKWVYEETIKQGRSPQQTRTFIDTVGEPADILGTPAVTFISKDPLGNTETLHFVVTKEEVRTIFPVGTGEDAVPSGYPVFKFTTDKTAWDYSGVTTLSGDPVDMILKASSRSIGQRDVLGTKRDAIEVKMEVLINAVPESDFGSMQGATIKTVETSIYARGVGLVETKSNVTYGKNKMERSRKLVSYTVTTE